MMSKPCCKGRKHDIEEADVVNRYNDLIKLAEEMNCILEDMLKYDSWDMRTPRFNFRWKGRKSCPRVYSINSCLYKQMVCLNCEECYDEWYTEKIIIREGLAANIAELLTEEKRQDRAKEIWKRRGR